MNYSKGISWFDDCRIPFVDEEGINFHALQRQTKKDDSDWGLHKKYTNKIHKPEGRFPANLLCSDDMLNDVSSRYYDIDAWFDNLLENYIY